MNKDELLVIGSITLVGLFLLRVQSQEPTGGEGWSIFPQPEPRISPPPEPPEPMLKKSVQPLTINFPTIDIPPPPPPPSSNLPNTSGSKGGSRSGGGDSKNIMPVVLVQDTSPQTIREHIIVPFGEVFTGGEKIPVVTKKGEIGTLEIKKADIELNIPPGLSPTADALKKDRWGLI